MKGIASNHDLESSLDHQQWHREALRGESTGAVMSSEITTIRRQTLSISQFNGTFMTNCIYVIETAIESKDYFD